MKALYARLVLWLIRPALDTKKPATSVAACLGTHPTKSAVSFPRPLSCRLLTSTAAELQLTVELPIDTLELWFKLVSGERIIGYVQFKKAVVLRPGLSTYVASEFRGLDDPPRPQAVCQSVFPWLCPEDYELLLSEKSALPG